MNKSLHLAHSILVLVAIISLVATVNAGITLWKTNKINYFISHGSESEQVPEHLKAQFSQAFNDADKGETASALQYLTAVVTSDDLHLKTQAYFNRGNIHLREAQALTPDDPKRLSLIELAKQDYRTALILDPSLWNVRFNLELALLMLPEKPVNKSTSEKNITQKSRVQSVGFRVDLP